MLHPHPLVRPRNQPYARKLTNKSQEKKNKFHPVKVEKRGGKNVSRPANDAENLRNKRECKDPTQNRKKKHKMDEKSEVTHKNKDH